MLTETLLQEHVFVEVIFIRSHKELKFFMLEIFKKAGFAAVDEARNLFHGKVPDTLLRRYLDEFERKNAIIPDILVDNYIPDSTANGATVSQASFDIKTLRIDKNSIFYNCRCDVNSERAVAKRVKSTEHHISMLQGSWIHVTKKS